MRYQHLERIRVTLENVSPVCIGSGEKLMSRECVYLKDKGIVYIPDLKLLLDEIKKHGCMPAYERFLFESLDRDQSLGGFLYSMNIPVNENAPWVRYRLNVSSGFNRLNDLTLCMKNAQGLPYIPGSSIKGAIRTALLSEKTDARGANALMDCMENNPKQRWSSREEYPLRRLSFAMKDGRIMEGNAVNDLLKALQVSDSAPYSLNSLIVCKKMELTVSGELRGDRGGRSSSPVFRECIRPGSQTHFYLTIDKNIAGSLLNPDMIIRALSSWYALQREYIDQFSMTDIGRLEAVSEKGVPLILGCGVGFQQHSLVYRAADRDKVRRLVHRVLEYQFTNNRNGRCSYKPREDDPAPYLLKLVKYNNLYYPMGHCRITLEA